MRREPSLQGSVAREHGLWSASEIAALRGRAVDEVVEPCARALFRRSVRSGIPPRFYFTIAMIVLSPMPAQYTMPLETLMS
jgi:hypothetical protein